MPPGRCSKGQTAGVLQQLAEFLFRQAGVVHDATPGIGIHRIVSRDSEGADTISHNDMFALTDETETHSSAMPERHLDD